MAKVKREPLVVAQTRGPEFTKVDDETERKIPFRTWLTCIVVWTVDIAAAVVILILISRQVYNWMHPPRIYGRSWGASVWRALAMWSPTIGIGAFGGVIAWSLPLLYRYLLETTVKHPPQYTPYPSEYGLWNPLPSREAPDDEEYEQSAARPETVNLRLWELGQGKRKTMQEIPDLMSDARARQFYRALAGGGATFSEREAKRFDITPGEFRQYIRDPLIRKGRATWKNKLWHRQGVDLSDNALVSLGHLGRTALPRNRA